MSKTNAFENAFLALIFNADPIAGLADDDQTSPLTDLYVSLHTSSPGEGGSQTSNEISYTGYARVAVARDNTGWTVAGDTVTPAADIDFGLMTAGAGGTVTHLGIGSDPSGAGNLYFYGTVSPNIVVANGVIPRITDATTITED